MKQHLLPRVRAALVLLTVLVASFGFGQEINEASLSDFIFGKGAFASDEVSLRVGKEFIQKQPLDHRSRPVVCTTVASLLYDKGDYADSIAMYKIALESKAMSESQKVSCWANIANITEHIGDHKQALLYYRKAYAMAGNEPPQTRKHFLEWIHHLELSEGTAEEKAALHAKIIAAVKRGSTHERLPGECQSLFRHATDKTADLLFDAIALRFVKGNGKMDNHLLSIAYTSYRKFEDSYPSVVPFGALRAGVQARLLREPQAEGGIDNQVAWSQALGSVDRAEALVFTAECVRHLKPKELTESEREDAIRLVHQLESFSSLSDPKAQALITEKLKELNAKSVVMPMVKLEPEQRKSSNKLSTIAFAAGIVTIGLISWKVLRKG